MNKNFSNRLKSVGTNESNRTPGSGNRSSTELKIGINNKEYYDSKFTRAMDTPTAKGTYYQIDKNSSSYSEKLKLVGDPNKSKFFNKINNMYAYNVAVSEEVDKRLDEERSPSINLTDKTLVIPAGSIRPIEGDHWVMDSHTAIKKPFVITLVTEKALIDREVYEITLKESNMYTLDELEERVVNEFEFLEANVGSGNKVILEKRTVGDIQKLKSILRDLNKEYIEVFYDEEFDMIRCVHPNYPLNLFSIRSLSKFQDSEEVLRYGFDSSMLFINNDYDFNLDDSNYNSSLYKQITKKRKFKSIRNEVPPMKDKIINQMLDEMIKITEIHNYERDLVSVNENDASKIGTYEFKFYNRTMKDHMVMTRLYNSGTMLIELLEVSKNMYNLNNTNVQEDAYKFKLNNKLYIDLLDHFYEYKDDVNKFFDFLCSDFYTTLEDYSIFSNDINDMIFFPILKYIIEDTINEKTKDKMFTSY